MHYVCPHHKCWIFFSPELIVIMCLVNVAVLLQPIGVFDKEQKKLPGSAPLIL